MSELKELPIELTDQLKENYGIELVEAKIEPGEYKLIKSDTYEKLKLDIEKNANRYTEDEVGEKINSALTKFESSNIIVPEGEGLWIHQLKEKVENLLTKHGVHGLYKLISKLK